MKCIQFRVNGRPLTQGSMIPMRNKKTGGTYMMHKKGLVEWRRWVGDAGCKSMESQKFKIAHGPVRIFVEAMLVRPKKHYRTGRFSDMLRDDAPVRHIQAPDSDKLMRAIMDALTDVVYRDDAQVFDQHLIKRWVGRDEMPGIIVHIDMLDSYDEMGSSQ